MKSILITNATVINENCRKISDIYIKNGRIEQIAENLSHIKADNIIDATNKYLIPGMIDDQVHFREPGLTDKADIRSESLAGVIGGTTTYMDMPNNKPPIITNEGLDKKFLVAGGGFSALLPLDIFYLFAYCIEVYMCNHTHVIFNKDEVMAELTDV